MNVDLTQLYREINITNVGRIFAYLTFVSFQRDSEESIRLNVRRCVEAFRMFDVPKPKRNKQTILVTLSLALIALYVRFRFQSDLDGGHQYPFKHSERDAILESR